MLSTSAVQCKVTAICSRIFGNQQHISRFLGASSSSSRRWNQIKLVRCFSDWEKAMQRDANISGRAGSIKGGLASMQDNFMAKLGGEFGGERVSSLVRLETKLGNEIKALNALRDTLTASHSSTSSENITDFNKQRSAVQSRRQDLIVQRELSGMGTGATDAVLKEFPCPQAL